MGTGDSVMMLGGEAFFETTEDEAVAACDAQVEKLQGDFDALDTEAQTILAQQAELKALLYERFGKSINLESD